MPKRFGRHRAKLKQAFLRAIGSNVINPDDVARWTKAVVHLEGAESVYRLAGYKEAFDHGGLREKFVNKEISWEQYTQSLTEGSRNVRLRGTAVWLRDAEADFLVTAQHVLFTDKGELRNPIFRVPSYDESLAGKPPEFLMNLRPGAHGLVSAAPDADVAVISLCQHDIRTSGFRDELITLGYEPICANALMDRRPRAGKCAFTVGFPGATAVLGEVTKQPALDNWRSRIFATPIASFGHVAMSDPKIPHIWCDMTIYPGNSGGPVIVDGQLAGVVSAQPPLPVELRRADGTTERVKDVFVRTPFAEVVPTEAIYGVLNEQREKDANRIKSR